MIRFCEPLLAPHELVAVKLTFATMTIDKQFLHLLHLLTSSSDPTEDIVYFADRAARADVPGRIERARVRRADSPLRIDSNSLSSSRPSRYHNRGTAGRLWLHSVPGGSRLR